MSDLSQVFRTTSVRFFPLLFRGVEAYGRLAEACAPFQFSLNIKASTAIFVKRCLGSRAERFLRSVFRGLFFNFEFFSMNFRCYRGVKTNIEKNFL